MSPVTNIQPFQIAVSDGQLDDLKQRLKLTRLPDELDEAGWEYGAPLKDVKRLVARWQEGYDWRRAEAELNRMPQFTADVEVDGFGTLNIHFVHQKSAVKDAIPLFFSHGCEFITWSPAFGSNKTNFRWYRARTFCGGSKDTAAARG